DGYFVVFVSYVPSIGQLLMFLQPLAGSGRPTPKPDIVPPLPLCIRQTFRPYSLRLGSNQNNLTETFQLFVIATIDQFVVSPMLWSKELDAASYQNICFSANIEI